MESYCSVISIYHVFPLQQVLSWAAKRHYWSVHYWAVQRKSKFPLFKLFTVLIFSARYTATTTLYQPSGYFPLILTPATANVSSPGLSSFADPCMSQGKEGPALWGHWLLFSALPSAYSCLVEDKVGKRHALPPWEVAALLGAVPWVRVALKRLVHRSTPRCRCSAELHHCFASRHGPSFSLLHFQALLLVGSLITANTEDFQNFSMCC